MKENIQTLMGRNGYGTVEEYFKVNHRMTHFDGQQLSSFYCTRSQSVYQTGSESVDK